MKSEPARIAPSPNASLPVRGAWIEIVVVLIDYRLAMSLPVRGAWIEIAAPSAPRQGAPSLPVRGAWIEMPRIRGNGFRLNVAPRAGSVD